MVDYLEIGRWAAATPQALALAAPNREPLTYSALWDHLRAASDALCAAGVHPGGVAAVVLPNGPDFLTAVLAVTLRSACAPLDPGLTQDEYRRCLQRIQAPTLILEEGAAGPIADVARELGMRLIHLQCSPHAPAGIFSFGKVEAPSTNDLGRQIDAALLMMTSSTTGIPKLVPRSRDALRIGAAFNAESFEVTPADRYLCCMPLNHSHGISEAVTPFVAGAGVFCAPAFDANKFPSWLESFRPTWFSASPAMQRVVLTLARETPEIFASLPLRFIRSATAAPDPDVILSLEKLLGVPVLNGYGLTEATCAIRSSPTLRKPGSVGKAVLTEVAILDEAGNLLPPEREGEVLLRGPTVMSGYLDNPEANQEVFQNGWFRTGDIGRLDHERYLFITGRLKEVISRGGKKISPQEVDTVLARHPAIAAIATFAIPHRTLGEDVAAAAVLRENATVSELELRRFAAEHLSACKIPRRIVFVESLPTSRVGKPKRSALAEQFRHLGAPGSRPRPKSTEEQRPATEIEMQLIEIWRRILGVDQIEIDDYFFDLGGDSLSASLMLAQAEQIVNPSAGMLDVSDFFDQPTVSSLAAILTRSAATPEGAGASPSRIVVLQNAGNRNPFFCFSESALDPYKFHHLARELGPDQPFVVVCPPPPTQSNRLLRARELAQQSAASMRSVRNHGPYLIGGYCYGGVVAFETALQLMEEGEEVSLLALFDTPTPGYPKILRQWSRYTQRGSEILREMARGKSSVSLRDVVAHLDSLRGIAAKRWFARANRVKASAGLAGSQALESWISVVMREYTPRAFRAPIVHFLGDAVAVSTTVLQDARLGWQDFAQGGFRTIRVPGDHSTMLSETNAPVLAAELEDVLRAAAPAQASRAVAAQ